MALGGYAEFQSMRQGEDMLRTLGKTLMLMCAGLVLSTTLATAATMYGTVTAIASDGMATVKTDDGKEYRVKGEGWKVGAKVECEVKEGKTECKAM
jgi:hypothetical protein